MSFLNQTFITTVFIIDANNAIENMKVTENPTYYLYFLLSSNPVINVVVMVIDNPIGIPNIAV